MDGYLGTHPTPSEYTAGLDAYEKGDLSTAQKHLSTIPPMSPFGGLALATQALVELRLDKFAQSEETSKTALSLFAKYGCPYPPANVQVLRTLAIAIRQQGRVFESIPVLDAAIRLADCLFETLPDYKADIFGEKAHALSTLGTALIAAERPRKAIDYLLSARTHYSKLRGASGVMPGLAETLTNLASAYINTGNKTSATFALEEASQLAKGDEQQTQRIDILKAQAGLLSSEESKAVLRTASLAAENDGLFDTAYLRRCIACFAANEANDHSWAEEELRLAKQIESKLEQSSVLPAKLSFLEADHLERTGRPTDEVLKALINGAETWCDKTSTRLQFSDFCQVTGQMHDHFRKLSAMLLNAGRSDESFVSFESGRARAFALETAESLQHPLLETNSFHEGRIDCTLLSELQQRLGEHEVVISVAILPPRVVAFIVGTSSVDVCAVDIGGDADGADAFETAVDALPERLRHGKGGQCIPEKLLTLATAIKSQIGSKRIAALSPHSILHKVPWRLLLRSCGVPWTQLSFVTLFTPILSSSSDDASAIVPKSATALSYGSVGSGETEIDFNEEAAQFINHFGTDGRLIHPADSAAVRDAFLETNAVLLSCHGSTVFTEFGSAFFFDLADGFFKPADLAPKVNSPLIILSACSSGVYDMAAGDYPIGAAPHFLMAGARYCACCRFPIQADFARFLFPVFGKYLADGHSVELAFAEALNDAEGKGYDLWRLLACVELLGAT